MEPIRLLLLDDHVLFRESLSRLLASEPDFEMAGHCGTPAEALEILSRQTPVDIVLLDFDLGEDHATQFIAAARATGFDGKILMVTAGMNATESSLRSEGASGIFLKHNSPGQLAQAIRLVAAGEMWVDRRCQDAGRWRPAARRTLAAEPAHKARTAGAAGIVRRADE